MSLLDLIQDFPAYWRFGRGLRDYLGNPQTVEGILEGIESRRRERSRLFLEMAERCIYKWPGSPYLELLKMAGCTLRGLQSLVRERGVERTLQALSAQGVYVRVDEFKGKRPIRRGSTTIEVTESAFRNPVSHGHLIALSGGSRSRGLRTVYEFRNLDARWTASLVLRLGVYDLLDAPIAVWYPVMPGAGPVVVLALARAGIYPVWFSPLRVGDPAARLRSRLGTRFIAGTGRKVEPRFPAPQFASFQEPDLVVHWLADQLSRHGRCTLMSYVTGAVRAAQRARTLGIDLTGAFFSVSSEPLTRAKKAEIAASGAKAIPNYSTMEGGTIAGGCLNPSETDEMHTLDDGVALIQHERVLESHQTSVEAFLLTGLLDSFPKVLFNTETGDQGKLFDRSCGCPFESMGFTRHLAAVSGFDKLTGAGMTFIGSDLLRILEEVLPGRFGGSSLDYQMAEEEDETGQTRLFLDVSPRLGDLDQDAIRDAVLGELRRASEAHRFMVHMWAEAKTVQIRRREPVATARGKLLPLNLKSDAHK